MPLATKKRAEFIKKHDLSLQNRLSAFNLARPLGHCSQPPARFVVAGFFVSNPKNPAACPVRPCGLFCVPTMENSNAAASDESNSNGARPLSTLRHYPALRAGICGGGPVARAGYHRDRKNRAAMLEGGRGATDARHSRELILEDKKAAARIRGKRPNRKARYPICMNIAHIKVNVRNQKPSNRPPVEAPFKRLPVAYWRRLAAPDFHRCLHAAKYPDWKGI